MEFDFCGKGSEEITNVVRMDMATVNARARVVTVPTSAFAEREAEAMAATSR
jgi:hypothetical protein